jgi:predicted LPLAT superfamily acyltransferase
LPPPPGRRCCRPRPGGDPTTAIDFLAPRSPDRLFRVAAMLRRLVVHHGRPHLGGNRYRIHFEPLADFTNVERGARDAAIAAAQRAYVARLEQYCRQAPYNWFNFFDFWRSAE